MDDESDKREQTEGISNFTSSDTDRTLSIRESALTCELWDKDHSSHSPVSNRGVRVESDVGKVPGNTPFGTIKKDPTKKVLAYHGLQARTFLYFNPNLSQMA